MNSKAMIGVIILVILAGGIWYMQGATPSPAPVATAPAVVEQPPVTTTVAQEPAPTGKVDDIIASLDGEQTQEAAIITAGDASADTVLSDGTAINDLSQTYDETQL